jgi:hypothetical protein
MTLPQRTVSSTFKEGIFAPQTDVVFLPLVEIWHDDLGDFTPPANPLRFVRNTENISSTLGGTYSPATVFTAFNFDIKLPDEQEGSIPIAELTIDNVDRQIVEAIRELSSAPEIKLYIVLADDPDTVEIGPIELMLRNARYDASTVTGELYDDFVLDEPWPAGRCTPKTTPGLF